MNPDNPIKYSDLIKPDSSIDDLIKKLDELGDSYMNVYNNIKQNAIAVKGSLDGVSGATEQGRKTIKAAAAETDKLTKAMKENAFAYSETARRIAELKADTHEQNTRLKLEEKLARSAAGSYDALSAQYSLNKMALNSMGEATEEDIRNKRALEEETNKLYERMKELQEATGKHQLNVGNYADATKGLRTQIMELTEELVKMRMEGKQDSEEYQQMSQKAARLKDAFTDAQAEIKNMASDTSALNSVLGATAAASGGFAAVTGAMSLFGGESEDVQEAQKKLQATIAITNGLTAIQAQLQHQSNLMLGIGRIQTLAKAKAEQLATKQTIAATIAQKALNVVANANPYVLLATALITVVGALVAFSRGAKEAKINTVEQQKALTNLNIALDAYNEKMDFAIRKAQAEGKSTKEINAMRMQQAAVAVQAAEITKTQYAEMLNAYQQVVQEGGKLTKEQEEQYKEVSQKYLEASDEVTKAKANERKVLQDISIQATNDARENQQTLTQMLRKSEDEKLKLITNGYDRQRAQTKASAEREIEDIQYRLDTEKDLTESQRKALNDTIVGIRKNLAQDLAKIDREQAAAELATRRQTEDMTNALMEEGIEKQRTLLATNYQRQLEDLDTQLADESDLTLAQKEELAKQRLLIEQQYQKDLKELKDQEAAATLSREAEMLQMQIDMAAEGTQEQQELRMQLIENQRQQELAANRQLAEDKRRDEADINAKYDAEALKQRQEFELAQFDLMQQKEASEFALLNSSETSKTKFALEQEAARLKKILELNLTSAKKMSDEEVRIIENQLQRIQQDIDSITPKDIYDVFGLELNDDQKSAIDNSLQYAMNALNQWMEMRVQAAQRAVEAANKEVDAAQRTYELEMEAKANGYAADVETSKKELELAKQNQKKALDQQKEAQAQQEKLQTIQQATNLITGISQIWAAFAATPYVAIALTALMLGSFAASKIMAVQAAKEQYAEGHVELLQGGSHASGNDIDLGTKADGTRRRAEGGEFFAVINKRNSRRFRKEIPEVINSLNDGTFADKYLNRFDLGGISVATNESRIDLGGISDDVAAIREANAEQYILTPRGLMMKYKNVKRIIRES